MAATAVVAVLTVLTVYEAALALGAISIGELPGEDAPGAGVVWLAGLLALLGALVVAFASIGVPDAITSFVRQLLPLAGAAFVVVASFTFDPYYAPSLRRYSDYGGFPSVWWLLSVAASAVVTAALSRVRPRVGMSATSLVLLICLFTFFFRGVGK